MQIRRFRNGNRFTEKELTRDCALSSTGFSFQVLGGGPSNATFQVPGNEDKVSYQISVSTVKEAQEVISHLQEFIARVELGRNRRTADVNQPHTVAK